MRAFFYRVFSFLFFVCVFSVRSVLFFCYRSFFSARELSKKKKKKERKKERNYFIIISHHRYV